MYVEIKELKRRNIEFESLLNKINTEEKQKVISRANRDLKIKTVPAASVLYNSISSEFTTACKSNLTNPSFNYTQTGQNIPQLDGGVDASSTQPQKLQGGPSPEFQSNAPFNYQCENCKDLFETNSTLKLHADQYQFGCEDCSICFTSEESFDRHELAEHPETFYTHHPIPNTVIQNSTKFNFSASYR